MEEAEETFGVTDERYQISPNTGVEGLRVARDGIEFRFYGLGNPSVRVQAASPPPAPADGRSWDWGAFDPRELRERAEQIGLPKLRQPPRDTIVLDVELRARHRPGEAPGFSREERDEMPTSFIPAAPYTQQPGFWSRADFFAQVKVSWRPGIRPLTPGTWVAVSFNPFDPHGENLYILATVADEWLFGPPEQQAAVGEMPPFIRPEGPEREWAEPLLEFAQRNGWTFDEAARLSVETVLFFEQQDSQGVTVIVRPPPGRTRRERRTRRARRVRFGFKSPRLIPQAEKESSSTWRWWL
jgi:hypothetical protein